MRTALVAGLAVLIMLAFGPPPIKAQSVVTVDVQDFAFQPHEWTIQVGTAVRWVNHDDWPHHVAAEDGKSFDSRVIAPQRDFQATFLQAGSFSYRCSIHPTMLGVITVQGQ